MSENESAMAMIEEEQSRMADLQKEGRVRAATDAEIQHELDRVDARDHLGHTIDMYLEKLARRVYGLDKRSVNKEIQRTVDKKHVVAEELNVRLDTLRDNLNQAYATFQEARKNSSWPKGVKGKNGFVRMDDQGEAADFSWTYKDPELERARQYVVQAKTELENFVNNELYEDSEKTYRDSQKGRPFSESLRDIDLIAEQ